MFGTDERVARQSAPCGQILNGTRIARDEAEHAARAERIHTPAQEHDELAATHVARVPSVRGLVTMRIRRHPAVIE